MSTEVSDDRQQETPVPTSHLIPTTPGSHTGSSESKDYEPILRYFNYEHLPQPLQDVSARFAALAEKIMESPRSAERAVALRKLLESKDAAVRAALPPEGYPFIKPTQ